MQKKLWCWQWKCLFWVLSTREPVVFIILSVYSLLCQNVLPNLNLYDLKMYDLIFPQFYIKTPGRCTFVFLRLVELCQGTYFRILTDFYNFIRVSVPKECDSWLKWNNPVFCFIFCICTHMSASAFLTYCRFIVNCENITYIFQIKNGVKICNAKQFKANQVPFGKRAQALCPPCLRQPCPPTSLF